jgi:CubicO group peptidase (beta-lactamase class C family)
MTEPVTTGASRALGDPEALGLDPAALDALRDRARREVDEGLLPSSQIALAKDGELVLFETYGEAEPDSRYTIFSMTKGVVAGAVWLLVGEGALRWDDRVSDLVPEFGANGKEAITVEQVITHTGGFPAAPMPPLEGLTSEGRCARFARWRTVWEPGTRYQYHPTAAHWVLAELIERASGTDYRSFVHDRIVTPLGMTTFGLGHAPDTAAPGPEGGNELVSVGELPTPAELEAAFGIAIDLAAMQGEVTTANLLGFNDPDVRAVGVPGAGGVCTAADIVTYYQGVLRNPGELWDPATLADALVPILELPDPIMGTPAHRSRGLVVAGDPPQSVLRGYGHGQGPRTFGHAGAGGQLAWADPDTGVSFCYLTNGLDEHLIRQARRGIGINSRAVATVRPS